MTTPPGQGVGSNAAYVPPAADMAIFDRLPLKLRRLIRECMFPVNCGQILHARRMGWSDEEIVDLVRRNEQAQIAHKAAEYQERHKLPYPHAAAGATILRGNT